VTDDEFIFAINRFGVDILSRKAAELVKRPSPDHVLCQKCWKAQRDRQRTVLDDSATKRA
jgi:hypothetical protein